MRCLILVSLNLLIWNFSARAENVVLVDKSKYSLIVADKDDNYKILKSYPVTIGKISGDKVKEGDQKTPEGIYQFTQKYLPPAIKPKLGAMAFYIDYPNLIDKSQGKTGFDIMLHSTNDPARLEKSQDSDGCVVMNNEHITDINSYITPHETVIMIYDELKPEYLQPNYRAEVEQVFDQWLESWNGKDLEKYIGFYAKDFKSKGMNREQYREYKNVLNKKYHKIEVTVANTKFYRHPKYSMISYRQTYLAKDKNDKVAFNVKSNKMLYMIPEDGQLKIYSEGN